MIVNGFHIEPTNICTLKCPGCARTQFIQKWSKHWKNHNLDINKIMNFLDIDLNGKLIHFCGNYGDPIYHPEFAEMVAAFKNRGSRVLITTNGSYRNAAWWNDLCNHLDATDIVQFSIDGTPENFSQYRINADWTSIKLGIDICVQRQIPTEWKYIPFSYNLEDIDQVRRLSQELGVTNFRISPSDRFDQFTEHLIPVDTLLGKRFESQQQFKKGIVAGVDPDCNRGKSYFITATGHFAPCCYIADHRFYYKTDFGKNNNLYDISDSTFSQMISKPTVMEFYDSIQTKPTPVCQFNCPKTT
jgi:pyruvate-formate lyase-activating enzyme